VQHGSTDGTRIAVPPNAPAVCGRWDAERGHCRGVAAFHEVDDVQHWLSSPKREEVFGPLGITARTFHDPEGSKRVGLIVEVPDMAAFQETMQSDAAAEAMKHDGPPSSGRGRERRALPRRRMMKWQ
jgi:hypothetical protein